MANEPSWEDIFKPAPTEPEPTEAAQPAAPEYPPTQVQPVQPAQPVYPPQQPAQYPAAQPQAQPAAQPQYPAAQPVQPAQPQYPAAQPQYPAAQPVQPAQPTEPQYPATVAQPVQQPTEPQYPAQPQYPTTPAYPSQPVQQPSVQQPAVQPAQQQPYPLQEPPATYQPTQAYPTQAAAVTPQPEYVPTNVQPEPAASTPPPQDSFSQLFAPQGSEAAYTEPVGASRRDSRAGGSGGSGGGDDFGGPTSRYPKPEKKKRKLLWLKILLPIVIVLGGAAAAGWYVWTNYEDQVREVLGIELPTDYEGNGNGKEVVVTIQSGDIGEDIARTLHDKGVTMTFDAFYDLLLTLDESPNFLPGNYALQGHMSAQSALDALLDPENKVTDKLLITEGTVLPDALEIIAETTGIPLEELQTASQDLASFGLPPEAVSLEGYLFPATYELDGGQDAHAVLQLLVDTMFEHLDAAGVAPEDRNKILTMAALIQREAGPNIDDFYKISRVFYNRLEQGINFESDATVAYGTGNLHTVFTTDAERADANNLYNTYVHPGMPYGPIGLPGDDAIKAAISPADGPWLFFVPINLATGETVFSETVEQHDAAVEQLQEWCAASPENDSYCGE